jgi:hypothetical protein
VVGPFPFVATHHGLDRSASTPHALGVIPDGAPPERRSPLRLLLLVASAALVASALHFASQTTTSLLLALAGGACGAGVWFFFRWLTRRRVRRMLLSGKADELIRMWHEELARMPHADTTIPLLQATALAANGLTERARAALDRAARGEAWQAAYEHRLMIETLLDTFEGDRGEALDKAHRLRALPMPQVTDDLKERIGLLREAVAAVARAFAHEAEAKDASLLWEAARRNALIHWPLRYAAAVVLLDRGEKARARSLIDGAPQWPEESAFRAFHEELLHHAAQP